MWSLNPNIRSHNFFVKYCIILILICWGIYTDVVRRLIVSILYLLAVREMVKRICYVVSVNY